ncbi:MAG: DUF2510 domain-containing protein [Actinomycetota bacterium]|nr:DUF2510 domain-containing protein [Actinomycetota bacterium]
MTEGQGGGTPAGWYPDPEGNGERWWNGASWGQLRPPPAGAPQQVHPTQYGHPAHGQHAHGQHAQQPSFEQQQAQPNKSQQWGQQQQPVQQPSAQGLRCVNCQFTDFAPAEYVLTPGGNVFDRGIGMATAQCLICRRCGFIHWFAAH